MVKNVKVEVNGIVTGLELSASRFFPRAPIDSMFVVRFDDEHIHGVSVEGDVFWRLDELERALKPGDWMRTFVDISDSMAVLSNTDSGEDFAFFHSVFLNDMGLFKMFAASISKTHDIARDGTVSLRVAKSIKIELSPGHLAAADVPNVDKFKLAPAIAKEIAKAQSETGEIGDHVQHNVDIYKILSRITIKIARSRVASVQA